MELFRFKKDIPFMRHALKFNILSLLIFLLAVFFLATRGLNLSVEFTGGTLLELHYPEPPRVEEVRQALSNNGYTDVQVQNFGSSRDILVRLPNRDELESDRLAERVLATLNESLGAEPELRRVEFVGPQVGKELASDGAMALLFVIIGIMAYLAVRFQWRFSVAASIANLHDVVVVLGFFAFFQWEFSLAVLAATLAALGYSVNETVIIFDRVRETFRKRRGLTTPEVINHSITRTMARTIITHGSTMLVVLSMMIFGGETLYYFSIALALGIVVGVYSSTMISSPLAMWFGASREQFIKPKKEKEEAVV